MTNDTPHGGIGGSDDDDIAELANLLDTPEPGHVKAEVQKPEEAEADEADTPEDPESEIAEDEGEEVDPDDEPAADEAEDEPAPTTSAAADDAVVTLEDGTQISVRELKRGWLRENDYTRKTMALSEESKTLEAQRQRVLQHAQQIKEQRELLASMQERLIPPMPDDSQLRDDPIGYLEARNAHENAVAQFHQLRQAGEWERQQQAEQQQAEIQKLVAAERQKLIERIPEFRNPEHAKAANAEMQDVFRREYGLEPNDYAGIFDHRAVRVMLDALAYRKLQAQKPVAKAKVENKPPVMKAGKRPSVQASKQAEHQKKIDRLRKTGSSDALEAVLMDLDL